MISLKAGGCRPFTRLGGNEMYIDNATRARILQLRSDLQTAKTVAEIAVIEKALRAELAQLRLKIN